MKILSFTTASLTLALLLNPTKAHAQGVVNEFMGWDDENEIAKQELEKRAQVLQEKENQIRKMAHDLKVERVNLEKETERNLTIQEGLQFERNKIEQERELLESERVENARTTVTQIEAFRQRESDLEAKESAFRNYSERLEKEKNQLAERLDALEFKEAKLEELNEYNLDLLAKMPRGFTSFMSVPECKQSLETNTFFAYDPLPISNWLMSTSLDSFYHYRTCAIVEKDDIYQNSYEVWLEPFAQHSNWDEGDISCEFYAYGFTLGGGVVIHDDYEVGLGFGYWRLDTRGNNTPDHFSSETDTFILGPYFSLFFGEEGYLSTQLWGGFNEYSSERDGEFCGIKQTGERDHQGWTVAFRSELGYTFYSKSLFVKPYVVFDYLSDFQNSYSERTTSDSDWEESLNVDSRHSNFLGTKVALECGTEIHRRGVRYLIPKLTLGWLYYRPLSQGDSDVTYFSPPQNKLGAFSVDHKDYSSDNLVFAEGEATFLHANGFSTSLTFGAGIGSVYKNYTGAIRIERVW